MKKCKAKYLKIVTMILVFVMLLTPGFNALAAETDQTRASDYIRKSTASITAKGNGKMEISLRLTATAVMGQLGVSSMIVYESTDQTNWSTVGYYTYNTHANLIAYNTSNFAATLTQNGVAGRYYKAQVCFWAGNGTDGSSRYIWTSVVRAT